MGKASGWAIVVGCFLMVIGLALVPAAFGPHPDDSILGLGICTFSFGALAGAGGLYMKARAVQAGPVAPKPQPKRIRGGCDLCGSETPVIQRMFLARVARPLRKPRDSPPKLNPALFKKYSGLYH